MLKTTISIAAAATVLGAAAFAEECKLEAEAPAMPNAAEATAEDYSATIDGIKTYQAALGEYRDCLDAIIENEELETEARKAALDKFNATVDEETAMVAAWQEFSTAYKEDNS